MQKQELSFMDLEKLVYTTRDGCKNVSDAIRGLNSNTRGVLDELREIKRQNNVFEDQVYKTGLAVFEELEEIRRRSAYIVVVLCVIAAILFYIAAKM